jgi:hypothetical protein
VLYSFDGTLKTNIKPFFIDNINLVGTKS